MSKIVKPLVVHSAWAALAAGAYFVGKSSVGQGGEQALGADAGGAVTASGPSFLVGADGDKGAREAALVPGAALPVGEAATQEAVQLRVESILAQRDPLLRKSQMAAVLASLRAEQVPGVLAAFEGAPRDDETDREFREFLYAWGRVSGGDAMTYLMDPKSARRDRMGGGSAVAGWAAVDPAAAMAFVEVYEDDGARPWLHYGVMREVARTDLDGAIAYAEQNEKSNARGRQLEFLGERIFAERGVDGMVAWLEGIDHTAEGYSDLLSYKTYATGMVLDRLAAEDVEAARAWIEERAGEPYVSAGALERAARRAGDSVEGSIEWLASLPDEVGGRRHAIGERFEDYLREDFAAAGQWLAGQELGPLYDEAVQDYALSAARDDREAAIAWAERITDAGLRAETERRLGVAREQPVAPQG